MPGTLQQSSVDSVHGRRKSRVRFERRLPTLDLWVVLATVLLGSDDVGPEELHVLATDGQYLLSGRECPDQTGHNAFEVRQIRVLDSLSLFLG